MGFIVQCGWRYDSSGRVGLVEVHTEQGLGVMVSEWVSNPRGGGVVSFKKLLIGRISDIVRIRACGSDFVV
jgi:hypothetical protein